MNKKTDNILERWHKYFKDEDRQYSEFESSDIEYFVGCLLYNHFEFTKALDTMKTMDLSYDFLESCGDVYDEIMEIVKSIVFEDEMQKLEFLQNFILDAKKKYSEDELYLLNRLQKHIDSMADRYDSDEEVKNVEFVAPIPRSANPLLR